MKKVFASLLVVASLVGCSNWNKYTPAPMDNTAIEEEVRKNLAADKISGLQIDVANGVVTLKGHLSAADRTKAVDDARKVKGVTNVVDNISLD